MRGDKKARAARIPLTDRNEPPNTAECEVLSSQIANFTEQFFGDTVKTEVNGKVEWSLPCDLGVELENNPRLSGEPLGCYMQRLFQNGATGDTGETGTSGLPGKNGNPAYGYILHDFVTPDVGHAVTVPATFNPVFSVKGIPVFIDGSGWYVVLNQSGGSITLLSTQKVSNPLTITPYGSLILTAGTTGLFGPQGVQGVKGFTGDPGIAGVLGATGPIGVPGTFVDAGPTYYAPQLYFPGPHNLINQYHIITPSSSYFEIGGSGFSSSGYYANVYSAPTITFPNPGLYFMRSSMMNIALFGTASTNANVKFKLRNITTNVDVPLSNLDQTIAIDNLGLGVCYAQVQALVTTTGVNQAIGIFMEYNTGSGQAFVQVPNLYAFRALPM